MAKMTTRKRIKWQMRQAREMVDETLSHLHAIDSLAEEVSPYINANLPIIVLGLVTVKAAMDKFNEGL